VTTYTTDGTRALRVSELAALAGVLPETVRYYERVRLLPPPARTAANHRAYDLDAVWRVRFIQAAQRLGLRLQEIGDLLCVRDTGTCRREPAEQLLRRRLAELDAQAERLAAFRAEVVTMIGALSSPASTMDSPQRVADTP
jgi:DNA-binding transcriptional MerR regulator